VQAAPLTLRVRGKMNKGDKNAKALVILVWSSFKSVPLQKFAGLGADMGVS